MAFRDKAFASSDLVPCALTGQPVHRDSCHVDHLTPFEDLVKRFVDEYKIQVHGVEFIGYEDGATSLQFKDAALKELWTKFHAANAVMRITTAKANLSRPRKGV
jgi:hypothetical protein